jgi:hypothetical protein
MNRKIAFVTVLGLLVASMAMAQTPCLQIRAIYLETTHESLGWLGNDAEIEAYAAQPTPNLYSFKANTRAFAIFNGGYLAGGQIGLKPDINDSGKWYSLPKPLILNQGGQGVLLVEDDNIAGFYDGSSAFQNGFYCPPSTDSSLPNIPGILVCDNPSFSGSDDTFKGMIVLTGPVTLTQEATLDLGEWRVKIGPGCF